jgi:hypothetical protein
MLLRQFALFGASILLSSCATSRSAPQLERRAPASVEQAEEAPQDFVIPYDAATSISCLSNSSSVLELVSSDSSPATVHASADGTAYVFGATDDEPCPAQSPTCGDSWGNHVLIFHGEGYATFYAYLDHALIETGSRVRAGDPIGVEGTSGATTRRQLRWSVQKIAGNTLEDWVDQLSQGRIGESVPFHFTAKQSGKSQTFETAALHCGDQGPRFKGLSP